LLLCLAGAPLPLITFDYSVTRIGIEPARELLSQMLRMWNRDWREDTPGFREFTQCRGEFVGAFLEGLDGVYGNGGDKGEGADKGGGVGRGVEGFVRGQRFQPSVLPTVYTDSKQFLGSK
jgi:hypothetical protein